MVSGVCGFLPFWIDFSCVLYQTVRRGQCFIAPFTGWTNFGQVSCSSKYFLLYLLGRGLRPSIKSPKMPRPTENSAHVTNTSVFQENSIVSQDSSSSGQEMEVQSPSSFQPSTSQAQTLVQLMFMPYIAGPKIDWTVNDSLLHRFLKWKLKCENILDCELAMLPESKKCKKVIVWSGGFGMDQYVSWCLPTEGLCLDTIWAKHEDFCKPQSNEVRARFESQRACKGDGVFKVYCMSC